MSDVNTAVTIASKEGRLIEIESITSAMVSSALLLKDKYDALMKDHKSTVAEFATEQKRNRKKQEEELAQASASLKKEKKDWEEEKKKVSKTQALATKIKLDIGGTRFTTSLTTLTLYPDTMLGAMFSGRHAMATDEEGYHFIDRDGTHFGHILNYLRDSGDNSKFNLDNLSCASHGALLKKEADFYGLKLR